MNIISLVKLKSEKFLHFTALTPVTFSQNKEKKRRAPNVREKGRKREREREKKRGNLERVDLSLGVLVKGTLRIIWK